MEKKIKSINDFCLTTVAITAIVAISYMATVALKKHDKRCFDKNDINTLSIKSTIDNITATNYNDQKIKDSYYSYYSKKSLLTDAKSNECMSVVANNIVIKQSGYYDIQMSIRNFIGTPNDVINANVCIDESYDNVGVINSNLRITRTYYLKKGDKIYFTTNVKVLTEKFNTGTSEILGGWYSSLTDIVINENKSKSFQKCLDVKFDLLIDIVKNDNYMQMSSYRNEYLRNY
jgi:hypothetical protein